MTTTKVRVYVARDSLKIVEDPNAEGYIEDVALQVEAIGLARNPTCHFEHGQWWIIGRDGETFSVIPCQDIRGADYLSVEEISGPSEGFYAPRESPPSPPETIRMDGLEFRFHWSPSEPAAWGRLHLLVGGKTAWNFSWPWVDLLDFLTDSWKFLKEDKLELTPGNLAVLSRRVQKKLQDVRALEDFLEVHDLARGVPGALAPSIWAIDTGDGMLVVSHATTVSLPKEDVLSVLRQVGDAILARAEEVSPTKETALRNAERRQRWEKACS